jgi:hypothetical protein
MTSIIILPIFALIVAAVMNGKYFKLSKPLLLSLLALGLIGLFNLYNPHSVIACGNHFVFSGCVIKITPNNYSFVYLITEIVVIGLSALSLILSFVNSKNRKKKLRNSDYVKYGFLGLLSVIVLLITGLFSVASYHAFKNISSIKYEYYRVMNNTNLHYSSHSCIDSNLDTPDYCAFYESTPSPQKYATILTSKLQSLGYVITTNTSRMSSSATVDTTDYKATNNTINMHFYYSVNPVYHEVDVMVSRASNPYY